MFKREFSHEFYESGHKVSHRIVNIVTYVVASIGILVMLGVPSYIVYTVIRTGNTLGLWVAVPTLVFALVLSGLLFYGVHKTQLPED